MSCSSNATSAIPPTAVKIFIPPVDPQITLAKVKIWTDKLTKLGILIVREYCANVTHVVSSLSRSQHKYDIESTIPVLNENWILDLVAQGKFPNQDDPKYQTIDEPHVTRPDEPSKRKRETVEKKKYVIYLLIDCETESEGYHQMINAINSLSSSDIMSTATRESCFQRGETQHFTLLEGIEMTAEEAEGLHISGFSFPIGIMRTLTSTKPKK